MIGDAGYSKESFINDSQKSDEEFQSQLTDLQCTICTDIMNDPRQCVNGHMFCKSCIMHSLQKCAECPSCSQPMSESNLSMCLLARNLINSLSVGCSKCTVHKDEEFEWIDENDDQCPWEGKVAELEKHFQECEYQLVKCPNKECMQSMLRRQLMVHAPSCEFRILTCEYCGDTSSYRQLSTHIAECQQRPVPCPNEHCSRLIKLNEVDKHRQECEWEVVDCPLQTEDMCSATCPKQLPRCELCGHLLSASTVVAMMHGTVAMKRRLGEVQFQLDVERSRNIASRFGLWRVKSWLDVIERSGDKANATALHNQLSRDYASDKWFFRLLCFEMSVSLLLLNKSAASSLKVFDRSREETPPSAGLLLEVDEQAAQLGVFTDICKFDGRVRVHVTLFRLGHGLPLCRTFKHTWTNGDVAFGWPDFISLDELEAGGYTQCEGKLRILVAVSLKRDAAAEAAVRTTEAPREERKRNRSRDQNHDQSAQPETGDKTFPVKVRKINK